MPRPISPSNTRNEDIESSLRPVEPGPSGKTAAIVVAAGKGTRMGAGRDKLYLHLAGVPVLLHTWHQLDAFPDLDFIRWVIRPNTEDSFLELAHSWKPSKPWDYVVGGAERQDSVWNGLEGLAPEFDWVAVHDAARPCVTVDLMRCCLRAAREHGASVAAQRAIDTIKESADGRTISGHLDRSRLWTVQTPQCFRIEVLRQALETVRSRNIQITDDTAACELIGQTVRLVESTSPNPKVTTPEDCLWVEYLLSQKGAQ